MPDDDATPPYRMWGGRFEGRPDARIDRFTSSLPTDIRLLRHDLMGSLAHARMLAETRIIPAGAAAAILPALAAMLDEAVAGTFPVDRAAEDVHTLIEAELARRIGGAAGWLHTARSRNDQAVTAFRLWVKAQCLDTVAAAAGVQEALLERGTRDGFVPIPAYTHLQRAQPVLLAHHLLAYVWMLARDAARVRRAYEAADVLPLGSGAVAGVSYPIDRELTARLLGFARLSDNSIDAVGDRDFAVEFAAALALLMVHLSRWAEQWVLWASAEFGFLELPDEIAHGSSIMPQKRNPDAIELIRGRSGRVLGDLVGLLTVLKGLHPAYGLDLQEDKALMFDAADLTLEALEATRLIIGAVRFRPDRMAAGLRAGFPTATDVADYLARHGVPFREAHRLSGEAVRYAEQRGVGLEELTAADWRRLLPALDPAAAERLPAAASVERAIAVKDVRGGTAHERVRAALEAARAEAWAAREWARAARARAATVEAQLRRPAGVVGGRP